MDRDVTYCVAEINTGCTAVMCNRTKLLLQIPPRERRKIKCDTKQPAGWLVDWRNRGRERTKRKQRIIWNISAMLSCRHPSWSDEIHKLVLNLCTIVYRISQLCQSWQLCPVAIFPFNRNIVFNETLVRTPSANLERSPFRVRWGYGQLTLTDRLSKDDRGLFILMVCYETKLGRSSLTQGTMTTGPSQSALLDLAANSQTNSKELFRMMHFHDLAF